MTSEQLSPLFACWHWPQQTSKRPVHTGAFFAANFVAIFCADFGHIFLKILTRLKKNLRKIGVEIGTKIGAGIGACRFVPESTYELALEPANEYGCFR